MIPGSKSLIDYDYAVRQTLLAQTSGNPYVRMIVEPSFESEWMVDVLEPSGGAAAVRLVAADKPVWHGGKPVVQPARTRAATLSSDTAEILRRIWVAMLRGVRPPAAPRRGVDGITYRFAAFVRTEGMLAGEVWSPDNGTQTERLVRLGTALRECVEAPLSQRTPLLGRLRNEAQALAGILGQGR